MRKSLIALCLTLAMTSTMAFTELDLPLFIAGLLNGFIVVHDLVEIQTCLKNAGDLVGEIEIAFEDYELNSYYGYMAGMAELAIIMNDLPNDLALCENI